MLGVAENHKIIEIYNFVWCNVTRLDLDRPLGMDETTLIVYTAEVQVKILTKYL